MTLVALVLLGSPLAASVATARGTSSPSLVAPAATATSTPLVASGSPGQQWTMFMGNLQHTSVQPDPLGLNVSTARNLSLLWSFQTGGVIAAEPTVLNDHVFFGSWDGREYALDANNGTLDWATYTGQSRCTNGSHMAIGITSTASLANGLVYVGGGGSYWYALSQASGAVVWKLYSGDNATGKGAGYYNWGSSIVVGNYLYFGLSSHCDDPLIQGQVLKVNLTTHLVSAEFNTTSTTALGATVWSTPAINTATNTLFFATGNLYPKAGTNSTLDDSIIDVNATTMKYIDHYQVPWIDRFPDGDFGASVTLFKSDNGTPMVADTNKNGILYALDQSNLSKGPVWTYPLANGRTYSSAAFDDNTLYVGSSGTAINGTNVSGSIRAFNATTGAVKWADRFNGWDFGPIVAVDGLVIGAAGHEFAVIRASDGKVLFSFHAPDRFYGGPAVANGRIYIGDTDGAMYAFGLPLKDYATASPTTGSRPLSVHLHVVAFGGGQGYTFRWSFGDGTSGTSANPVHLYKKAGTYAVSVTVRDQNGATASTSLTITVTEGRRSRLPRSVD